MNLSRLKGPCIHKAPVFSMEIPVTPIKAEDGSVYGGLEAWKVWNVGVKSGFYKCSSAIVSVSFLHNDLACLFPPRPLIFKTDLSLSSSVS